MNNFLASHNPNYVNNNYASYNQVYSSVKFPPHVKPYYVLNSEHPPPKIIYSGSNLARISEKFTSSDTLMLKNNGQQKVFPAKTNKISKNSQQSAISSSVSSSIISSSTTTSGFVSGTNSMSNSIGSSKSSDMLVSESSGGTHKIAQKDRYLNRPINEIKLKSIKVF